MAVGGLVGGVPTLTTGAGAGAATGAGAGGVAGATTGAGAGGVAAAFRSARVFSAAAMASCCADGTAGTAGAGVTGAFSAGSGCSVASGLGTHTHNPVFVPCTTIFSPLVCLVSTLLPYERHPHHQSHGSDVPRS